MYIGCHISIRRGFLAAAKTCAAIRGNAFQFFPKNPRSLMIKDYDRSDAEACAAYCRELNIKAIAHTSYMTNLGASGALQKAVVESVGNDLQIADACGAVGLVVHFGKPKTKEPLAGYRTILSSLNAILDRYAGQACLLIENQAGEGGGIGTTFEELTSIRKLSERPEKIGFCLDTCHLFASGVWNGSNAAELLEKGQMLGYYEHLMAVHLNDSVHPTGSLRDRHANIGKGFIGREGFRNVVIPEEVRSRIPIVLETPEPAGYTHGQEIAIVRELWGRDGKESTRDDRTAAGIAQTRRNANID